MLLRVFLCYSTFKHKMCPSQTRMKTDDEVEFFCCPLYHWFTVINTCYSTAFLSKIKPLFFVQYSTAFVKMTNIVPVFTQAGLLVVVLSQFSVVYITRTGPDLSTKIDPFIAILYTVHEETAWFSKTCRMT